MTHRVGVSAASGAKPWGKRGPAGPWDAIVIGSGMGGMTTAAALAQVGRRVLILEQHYTPGGFTHVFRRPGYRWDVGVHAVGEVTRHSMPGRILHHLTEGHLAWASLGSVYDEFYFPDGFRIDFPDSPERFAHNLELAFPSEVEAIDDYLRFVRRVAGAMKSYYLTRALPKRLGSFADRILAREAEKYLAMRTRDVLFDLTDDPRLRAVLAAQWGYYGSVPSRSSFAMQALVVRHFSHGGYYPIGGAQKIGEALLGTVARAGGFTRVATDVEEILIEKKRAVGVRLTDGELIRAKTIVSAAGISSTVRRLLPGAQKKERWVGDIEALSPAAAHVCLYLGFKGNIREAGAGSANKWFYETWSTEEAAWDVGSPEAPNTNRAPVLYTSFPSLKDPTHDPGPEQRHTGEVVTFVPYEAFRRWQNSRWKKRGPEYEAFKKDLESRLLRQFLEHMPKLEPMLDHVELSTPLSTETFARPVLGSIYGLEPTPERFQTAWLRPRSPIPGLYFSGSDVATVGVVGAMMGGILAAVAAEPVRVGRLLAPLVRRPDPHQRWD